MPAPPPPRPGHSLPQPYYTDPAIFDSDRALLAGHWFFAGHASALPRPGDWITATLGQDSAIVARDRAGTLRAFANVCRHRGSLLCEGAGHAARFTCPYHGWTYGLDGRLLAASEMPADFDPAAHGLIALPVAALAGLIFVCFSDPAPDLAPASAALAPLTSQFGWNQAKIAATRSYPIAANWKLVLENYHECYHCAPAHPEFSACHTLARPGARRLGPADHEFWPAEPDGCELYRLMGSDLAPGFQTGSRDGGRLAPPMGQAQPGHTIFFELGLLTAGLAYADHGLLYRFRPVAVDATIMDLFWLVDDAARPGQDYEEAALTWLWDVTSQADKTIITRNQAGIASRFYRPGPYAIMEPATRLFTERYAAEFARLRPRPSA